MAGSNGKNGQNAFHVMAKNGNHVVLEWYLAKFTELGLVGTLTVNELDKDGYPPLFLVCSKGHKDNQDLKDLHEVDIIK